MTTASGSPIDCANVDDHRATIAEATIAEATIAEIEAALLASGLVDGAAVTAHEGSHGDTILVAHVVPCTPAKLRPAALQEHLHQALPNHPVPSRFVALDALPLDIDGEIDREALLEGAPSSGVFSTTAMIAATYDPLTAQLAALWADILGVGVVLPEDDFFRLGGDSLRAARLVRQIGDIYRVDFPIHALYQGRTLRACATVVHRAQHGREAPRGTGPKHWQADARLPADIAATIEATAAREHAPAHVWRSGEVFLTGATGFLGAFMLRDLLTTTTACVHCLVRAADPESAMMRVRHALAKYGLWQESFARRIHVVPGDLERPRFGLDAASFEALAYMVDAVFHCGARVNFVEPYATLRPTNVGGTVEVIRLAATGLPKPVHHVSSIAVFGPSGFFGGERHVLEDDDLDEYLQYLPYDVGYAASKWTAEKMVWEAGRTGLPVTVYRPGYILGDSRTGAGRVDDFLGRVVRSAIRLGGYPDLPRQRLEFVPVDYVSRAILHIAGRTGHQGRAHHLVPADPRRSPDLNDFFALVRDLGHRLSRWSYPEWISRTMKDAGKRDNPLGPLLPMLSERIYKDELTRWELHEDSPVYDASHAMWALTDSDIELQPLDRAQLTRYLRGWLAADRPTAFRPPSTSRRQEVQLAGR